MVGTGTELFPTCYECRLIWLHLLTGYGPKTWPWQGSMHFELLPWCCHGIGTVCVVLASSLCRNRERWCICQCQGVGSRETFQGFSEICCRRNICRGCTQTKAPNVLSRFPPNRKRRPSSACSGWKLRQFAQFEFQETLAAFHSFGWRTEEKMVSDWNWHKWSILPRPWRKLTTGCRFFRHSLSEEKKLHASLLYVHLYHRGEVSVDGNFNSAGVFSKYHLQKKDMTSTW